MSLPKAVTHEIQDERPMRLPYSLYQLMRDASGDADVIRTIVGRHLRTTCPGFFESGDRDVDTEYFAASALIAARGARANLPVVGRQLIDALCQDFFPRTKDVRGQVRGFFSGIRAALPDEEALVGSLIETARVRFLDRARYVSGDTQAELRRAVSELSRRAG